MGILQPLCLSYGNHCIFNLLSLQQLTLFWSSVTVLWPRCTVRLSEWHLFVQTEDLQIYWNLGCCPALAAENKWYLFTMFSSASHRWCLKWVFRLNSSQCMLGSRSSKSCGPNITDLEYLLDLIYCQLTKTSEYWVGCWVKKENINKNLVFPFLIWRPLVFTAGCGQSFTVWLVR